MKKLLNKKGFTLMEMLIVVAIIVILVAISVPTFTANLDEAKTATDDANMRAAKSAAVIYIMDKSPDAVTTIWYDAENGKISTSEPEAYGQVGDAKDKAVKIVYTPADADAGTDASYDYTWE